jgi:hypothetical protein
MPKFLVPITRDTTETTMVDVVADNPRHAVSLALDEVYQTPQDFDFTPDDCSGGDPYFAGGSDLESVEEVL